MKLCNSYFNENPPNRNPAPHHHQLLHTEFQTLHLLTSTPTPPSPSILLHGHGWGRVRGYIRKEMWWAGRLENCPNLGSKALHPVRTGHYSSGTWWFRWLIRFAETHQPQELPLILHSHRPIGFKAKWGDVAWKLERQVSRENPSGFPSILFCGLLQVPLLLQCHRC